MSLERKTLKAMGLSEEQESAIMSGHIETVNALQTKIDDLTSQVSGYAKAKAELETAKQELEQVKKENVRLSAVKEEYETYKKDISAKETRAAKEKAYTELLKSENISRVS